jgi:hypothetical protein
VDKTITTALLIIGSTILVLLLFNATYPAIIRGGEAVTSMANNVADRMVNDVSIIHVSAELDRSGWWTDTNASGTFDVFGWVKNVGSARIPALNRLDVFFGAAGNFTRIPHQADAGSSYPYWTWELSDGDQWSPTTTLQIAVHYQTPLASGLYYLKVTLPNGVASDYFVGI